MPESPSTRQRRLGEEARDAQLAWVIGALDVDCVLDVGANRGQFGRSLRALGYAGALVSFEPAATPLADLRSAAADDPDWRVCPWGLAERAGTATLHGFAESELGSLHGASDFGRAWKPLMAEPTTETIEIRRLDDVWDDVTAGARRVLVKLDTQGSDLAVLRGAGDHARTGGTTVALLSEVACLPIYDDMPLMAEALATYADWGWSLAGLHPVSFDDATLRVIEFDALLVAAPEA